MHRTIIALAVAFMFCGVAVADKAVSSKESGKMTTSVTPDSQSTAMIDLQLSTEKKLTKEEKKTAKAKAKKGRRMNRVPNYFRSVVTEEQRAEIYKIQKTYAPTIAEQRAKLVKVIKERNKKIYALLTPEQLAKVKQMKQAAKAKRKAKAEKASATEGK